MFSMLSCVFSILFPQRVLCGMEMGIGVCLVPEHQCVCTVQIASAGVFWNMSQGAEKGVTLRRLWTDGESFQDCYLIGMIFPVYHKVFI